MTITASVPTLGSGTRYVLHKLHLDKESIETRMNKRGDEQDSSNYNAREDWVVFFFLVLAFILTHVLTFSHPLSARLRNVHLIFSLAICSFSSCFCSSLAPWLLLHIPPSSCSSHPQGEKKHFPINFICTHLSVRKILLGFMEINIALLLIQFSWYVSYCL